MAGCRGFTCHVYLWHMARSCNPIATQPGLFGCRQAAELQTELLTELCHSAGGGAVACPKLPPCHNHGGVGSAKQPPPLPTKTPPAAGGLSLCVLLAPSVLLCCCMQLQLYCLLQYCCACFCSTVVCLLPSQSKSALGSSSVGVLCVLQMHLLCACSSCTPPPCRGQGGALPALLCAEECEKSVTRYQWKCTER